MPHLIILSLPPGDRSGSKLSLLLSDQRLDALDDAAQEPAGLKGFAFDAAWDNLDFDDGEPALPTLPSCLLYGS